MSHCLKAFQKAKKGPKDKKDSCDRLFGVQLPFIQGTMDKIVRILKKFNISSTFKPSRTI